MTLHLQSLVSLLLPVQIVLVLLTSATAYSYQNVLVFCIGDGYSSPGPFETSLDRLLDNLTLSVSNSPSLFMSVSGYVGSSSSQIFALAQCRPGSPILSCTHCLMVSVSAIRNSSYGGCGLLSSAAAVFDLCFIRYSDQPVFGTPDYTYRRAIMSIDTTTYSKQFSYLVGDLLWRLSKEAAARASRFAVGVTDTNLQHEPSIYGLAWCTGDLSSGDCGICLPMAMDGLDFLRIGGRSAFVGCLLMYDIKVFFDMSFLNSTTSGRPIDHAGGNANGTRGKGELLLFEPFI